MTAKQFTKQLEKLVSFVSISSDLSENSKLFDYVQSLIDPRAKVTRIINDKTAILIASYQNNFRPDIAYLAHSDVVAGETEQFKMKAVGDSLIGRGVSDMKYSIPIGIALLNELIENQSELSFALVITSDEEVGGFDGINFLVESGRFDPTALIVPDGGDNFQFIQKSKGVCQLKISATGKAAHASMPWEGDNALEKIVKLSYQLLDKFGKNNTAEGWETTINIGQIVGGESTNQVCDKAMMKLDFRYPESQSKEEIFNFVSLKAKSIDPTIVVEYLSTGLPTTTNCNLPIVKKFIASFETELGKKIVIRAEYGASDARHFSVFKTPILMIKPTGGDIHGPNEWVSLDACMKFYQGLRIFLGLKK